MKTIKILKQQVNNITKDGSVEGRIYSNTILKKK